jgi:hypothetical protein
MILESLLRGICMSYVHFVIDSGNLAGKIQNISPSKTFHYVRRMCELTQAQKYAHLVEPEYMNIFFLANLPPR